MTSDTKKSIQKTVNKVRETASAEYQANVPVLKDNNLASFKEAFFAYQPAVNEFYVGIVNLFAKIIWNTDRFNHKLSFLKKGNYTIGYDIEEIHTNPVNPALYDNTDGAGILGDYPPEVLTAFYRENRHDVFPLTTNSEILSRAMDSWERLGNFINSTRIAVDNGNALREFNLLKQSIVGMYEKSGFVTREVDSSTDEGVADLMEQLRTDINDMQFLSSKFNKYKELFLSKNSVLNLISKNDEKVLEEKHIFDSLSIKLFFDKYGTKFKTLLDIGTGGGFPALPIAIEYPSIQITGIDSTNKKINAISDIAKDLELKNFSTICDRVENLKDMKFDLITSRAVAKLDLIIKYALPLLKKDGYLIVYKSKLVEQEIQDAKQTLKKYKAKVVDILDYKLPLKEVFERNLVIITHA